MIISFYCLSDLLTFSVILNFFSNWSYFTDLYVSICVFACLTACICVCVCVCLHVCISLLLCHKMTITVVTCCLTYCLMSFHSDLLFTESLAVFYSDICWTFFVIVFSSLTQGHIHKVLGILDLGHFELNLVVFSYSLGFYKSKTFEGVYPLTLLNTCHQLNMLIRLLMMMITFFWNNWHNGDDEVFKSYIISCALSISLYLSLSVCLFLSHSVSISPSLPPSPSLGINCSESSVMWYILQNFVLV